MSDTNAGRLILDVASDVSGLKRDLQRKLDTELKGVKANVGIKVDTNNLRRTLEDGIRRAALNLRATIGVKVDQRQLRTDLKLALDQASRGLKVTVGVNLDSARLRADVDAAIRRAQRGQKITIPIRGRGTPNTGGRGGGGGSLNSRDAGDASIGAALGVFKLAGIATAGTIAVGTINALAGAVVALGGALAPAAGALVAYPGILAGVGLAVGTVKLGFSGLGTAMKDVQQQQDATAAKTLGLTVAQYQQKKALDQLTPAQKQFGAYLLSLQPMLDQLKRTASTNLLPGLEQGLKAAVPLFPIVNQAVAGMGTELSYLGATAGKTLGGLGPEIKNVLGGGTDAVDALGSAGISLVDMLLRLVSAGRPLIQWMTQQIQVGAKWLDQIVKTKEAGGQLTQFFQRTRQVLTELGQILRNVGSILHAVFAGATPLGNSLLQSIVRLTEKGREWANSVQGAQKIRTFFDGLRPVITAVTHLFGDLLKGVVQLGTGSSSHLAPLINQLDQQLLPALLNIGKVFVDNGNKFGPALINALTQIAKLFATYARMSGGLGSLASTIGLIAQSLNWLISNVPGFSTLLNLFIGFVAAKRVMGPLISSFQSFGKGIGLVQKGLTTLMNVQWGTLFTNIRRLASFQFSGLITQLRSLWSGVVALAAAGWASITSLAAALGTQLALLGRAMIAPPVGIVLAIAAIGIAFYELYKHSTGFRNFVNAIARVVKTIFVDTFNVMKRVVLDVYNFFKKYWPIILAVLAGPIGIMVLLVIKNWNAIKSFFINIFRDITNIFRSVWNAIASFFTSVWNGMRAAVSTVFSWVRDFIKGVLHVLVTIWTTEWNIVKTVFTTIWNTIRSVVSTVFGGIKSFIQSTLGVISRLWHDVWGTISSVFSSIWGGIQRTFNTIMGGIEGGVRTAVGVLKSIWNGIKDVFLSPVRFMVNTVYNHGIRAIVNTIAGWVGISNALPSIPGFATGGTHVGPGQVGTGVSSYDDTPAVYRRGEHVWTPEEVSGAGGHYAVAAMRSKALGGRPVSMGPGKGTAKDGGRPHFLFGGLVHALGTAWDDTGGKVVHGIASLARDGAAAVVASTLGPLERGLESFANKFGSWGKDFGGMFHNLYNAFYNWVKGKDAQHVTSDPGPGNEVTRWKPVILAVLRSQGRPTDDGLVEGIENIIKFESGGNPQAINLTDSNAQKGDPSKGLMQTVSGTFATYAGKYASRGIYDPFANIYAGVAYAWQNYGEQMLRAGGRHTSSGGYQGYALGGTVGALPGGQLVRVAEGGRDETIVDTLSLQQGFGRLEAQLARAGTTFHTVVHNPAPEPASESVNSRLRRLAALRLIPS